MNPAEQMPTPDEDKIKLEDKVDLDLVLPEGETEDDGDILADMTEEELKEEIDLIDKRLEEARQVEDELE